eukprot:9023073-Heterocapsa_arctica.AAC.1
MEHRTSNIEHRTSKSNKHFLGGAGPLGRPLAITIRCATKRCTLFANYEPRRSNISLKHVNNRKRITNKCKRITKVEIT